MDILLNPAPPQNEGYPRDRHPFPVIDFKFRNSGNGTAFLTRYSIEILSAEIDIRPFLRFHWELSNEHYFETSHPDHFSDPRLSILAKNFGWGPAKKLSLTLLEDELPSLFGIEPRVTETVNDDEPMPVAILDADTIRKDEFDRLAGIQAAYFRGQLSESEARTQHPQQIGIGGPSRYGFRGELLSKALLDLLKSNKAFIRVNRIPFKWTCVDLKGRSQQNEETLYLGGELLITEEGFLYAPQPSFEGAGGAEPPGPTFCAIIDADRGGHIRSYAISRQIPPGDVERFQILIGATKSCYLELRFSFDVDGKTQVKSAPFELYIENRRDQSYHYEYRDGQEILASVTEIQETRSRTRGRWD